LAGGPIGKVRDGDQIEVIIDRKGLNGSLNLISDQLGDKDSSQILSERDCHPELSSDPDLPDDTRLWAALQSVSGGTWGGCVFDLEAILSRLGKTES
jgi:dihydroxyacid dehydratase/phosphogluconate dehydratase